MEFEEKFDTDDYADTMLWLSAGATHTYESTGGWSGGAAKFTPSTSEGYSGLANFGDINARKVNIRFLYYVGSTYNDIADNNKWMIINRDPYADGTRVIIMQHPVATHECDVGVCANIDCSYSDYRLSDYLEEWICFEFESDLDANLTKVYLTTQDLVYNGTVIESHNMSSPETGNHGTITIIGGYYQGTKAADDNRYIKYDELKISTSGYIGPPAGFLGGSSIPNLTGVKIIGGSIR